MRIWMARGLVLGILAVAAYGFWQGTPQDVVNAVRSGNVDGLKAVLTALKEGRISKFAVDLPEPSVFAHAMLNSERTGNDAAGRLTAESRI